MTIHFQRELKRLRRDLLSLCAVVEEQLHKAIVAVEDKDPDLARQVIDGDRAIDRTEVEIEEQCLRIIALYQPVADDLRFVIAALKITNDLERIGDLAENISKRAAHLAREPETPFPFDFQTMADKAKAMISTSLDAFVEKDASLARKVFPMDDQVDQINRRMYGKVTQMVAEDPEQVGPLLHLLGVSRQIERIADLATNIAEDVVFMVEGRIVRHRQDHL